MLPDTIFPPFPVLIFYPCLVTFRYTLSFGIFYTYSHSTHSDTPFGLFLLPIPLTLFTYTLLHYLWSFFYIYAPIYLIQVLPFIIFLAVFYIQSYSSLLDIPFYINFYLFSIYIFSHFIQILSIILLLVFFSSRIHYPVHFSTSPVGVFFIIMLSLTHPKYTS